jgi:D-alanine-D-alanine ligase-like ATP-grasp enzyme
MWVAVISGGPSSEYEVSRKSAERVAVAMEGRHEVFPVLITRESM